MRLSQLQAAIQIMHSLLSKRSKHDSDAIPKRRRYLVKTFTLSIILLALSTFAWAQSNQQINQQNSKKASDTTNMTTLSAQNPERDFGYVIGDIIEQRVHLPAAYTSVDLSTLENSSRVSTWLQRRSASVESGRNEQSILTLRYQIINSPEAIVNAALPELTLLVNTDNHNQAALAPVTVNAWPFTLGPLTPDVSATATAIIAATSTSTETETETANTNTNTKSNTNSLSTPHELSTWIVNGTQLKPDQKLAELDTETPLKRVRLFAGLLAFTMLGWLCWLAWRTHRDRVRLPFTRALQDIKTRGSERSSQESGDHSWKTLHRAFNESAGCTINNASVDQLLEKQDWLRPFESEICKFYAMSAERYFKLPATKSSFAVVDLTRTLAASEKSNSR